MSFPLQGTSSVLPNSHFSPLTHSTHFPLNLMYPFMQDVQTVGADGSHWKHPFLRRSREQVLAGHLYCVVDGYLTETDVLLYLALIVSTSRQLLLRYLRDQQQ